MASTLTRSTRRSEPGLTTRSGTRNNVALNQGNHKNNKKIQSNIGKKRPRDAADHEDLLITTKKAHIAIEITSRPRAQSKPQSVVIKNATEADAAARAGSPPPKKAKHATQPEPTPSPPKPTNHHQKVVNGIKHELDRLQPNSEDLKAEKRKLRSQEGQRFKSELSAYFPEYDEIIGNEPKEDRELNS